MNWDEKSLIEKKKEDIKIIIVELEYAKQMMLKAFAHHLLIDAQADHKQWLLANFPPSLYTEHLF